MRLAGEGGRTNGAVRVRTTAGIYPQIRIRETPAGSYILTVTDAGQRIKLWRLENEPKRSTTLGEFDLPPPAQPGDEVQFELRVIGQTLTVAANGKTLGSVIDATFPRGRFGIDVRNQPVKSLEFLDLDAATTQSASSTPAPAIWIDATEQVRSRVLSGGKGAEKDGWIEANGLGFFSFGDNRDHTDAVVRAQFRHRMSLKVRTSNKGQSYQASVAGDSAKIEFVDGEPEILASARLSGSLFRSESSHELVFGAQGTQLRLWLDGRLLLTATDSRLRNGRFQMVLFGGDKLPPSTLRNIEFGDL